MSLLLIAARRSRSRVRTELAIPKLVALVVVSAPFWAMTGCQVASNNRPNARATESVSYMTVDELAAALAGENDVLLVEFCVPSGCFRCDEMREPIDRLASDQGERLTVRRVDIRQQPAVAWELDVTVCPSYIAFRDGEEVFRATYPTSTELIVSGLEESLGESSTDQLTLADR